MKFIIKLFPEIMIKSESVRTRFIKILTGNIRNILTKQDSSIAIVRHWDYIEVRSKILENRQLILDQLQKIPGIHHILEVEQSGFTDLHDIFEQVYVAIQDKLDNQTFCVRVKRKGKHSFSSLDAERYIGGGLNQRIESAKVKLTKPDVTVNIEIEKDAMFLVTGRHIGIGGYPIGTQEDVLSLISGGFDSGVSSYMFIRRGCRTHYCFFNLGGNLHEIGVKQMAHRIWHKYSSSHKVRFISVDFAPVVEEILTKVENGQMGVILKRMMVRAASAIAERVGIEAIVTGEALGQVSSQTLSNLRIIDDAADALVLRPLITHDKEDIINLAKQIGTDGIAQSMPEFCGVISKNPTVKAVKSKIEAEEQNFDFAVLNNAITNAHYMDIRDIDLESSKQVSTVETTSILASNDIIIDVRAQEEQDNQPLVMEGAAILSIPFFKLASEFTKLDQQNNYVLYCGQGVMSKIQALYLQESGFKNVKVFSKK